jgi:hypothetical protein
MNERPFTHKGAVVTKPSEIVSVHYVVDDVEEAIASERRRFMKAIGIAVLTVQCLPLIAHASDDRSPDGKDSADNLIIQSGPGLFSHVHDLLIPYAVLNTPPLPGVRLTTTEAVFHRHNVALTREQLIVVNQGGTVTQKASSHIFVIALAKGRHSAPSVAAI